VQETKLMQDLNEYAGYVIELSTSHQTFALDFKQPHDTDCS
jgi:hypothetical protein